MEATQFERKEIGSDRGLGTSEKKKDKQPSEGNQTV
jgi:hypothetical protein